MDICTRVLNVVGLSLNLVGAFLVFIFGIPSVIDREGTVLLSAGTDEQEKRRARRYMWLSWLGAVCLIVGFLLQLLAALRN